MNKLLYIGLAALMIMIFSFTASATTMDVDYDDLKYVNFQYPGKSGANVTEFTIELDGVDWDDFFTTAYCVDLDNTINTGTYYNISLTPITADSGNYLHAAWLMDQYVSEDSTLNQQVGLQLAVWEAIYDTNFTYNPQGDVGSYYTSYYNSYQTAISTGVDMWSSLGYQYATTLSYKNSWIKNQDLLVQMDPVPEPGTMLLLGMGIAGLGAAGRKRFRKK
jgi:hypothetical protein